MYGICLSNVWKSRLFGWSASPVTKRQRYHLGLHTSVMTANLKCLKVARMWLWRSPIWSHLRRTCTGTGSVADAHRHVFFLPFFRASPFRCCLLNACLQPFSLSRSHAGSELPFAALAGGALVFISPQPRFPTVSLFSFSFFFHLVSSLIVFLFFALFFSSLDGLTLAVCTQTPGTSNICAALEPRGIWVVGSVHDMIEKDVNSLLSSMQCG